MKIEIEKLSAKHDTFLMTFENVGCYLQTTHYRWYWDFSDDNMLITKNAKEYAEWDTGIQIITLARSHVRLRFSCPHCGLKQSVVNTNSRFHACTCCGKNMLEISYV